jgi:hypothetical protein
LFGGEGLKYVSVFLYDWGLETGLTVELQTHAIE